MPEELERAQEYREQAARLLRQVDKQADPSRSDLLYDMAATYVRMADQIEEIHRLDGARKKARTPSSSP